MPDKEDNPHVVPFTTRGSNSRGTDCATAKGIRPIMGIINLEISVIARQMGQRLYEIPCKDRLEIAAFVFLAFTRCNFAPTIDTDPPVIWTLNVNGVEFNSLTDAFGFVAKLNDI